MHRTPAELNDATAAPDGLPAALRPRADEDERARRANVIITKLSDHARSPLVEPRFLDGARGLALALAGLAAMRANGFAGALADELAARLEPVLAGAEGHVAAVLPALADARAKRRRGGRRAVAPPPPGQARAQT